MTFTTFELLAILCIAVNVSALSGVIVALRKRRSSEANTALLLSSLIAMVTCAHASSLLAFAQSPWTLPLLALASAASFNTGFQAVLQLKAPSSTDKE
jgi:hypothetical protein